MVPDKPQKVENFHFTWCGYIGFRARCYVKISVKEIKLGYMYIYNNCHFLTTQSYYVLSIFSSKIPKNWHVKCVVCTLVLLFYWCIICGQNTGCNKPLKFRFYSSPHLFVIRVLWQSWFFLPPEIEIHSVWFDKNHSKNFGIFGKF